MRDILDYAQHVSTVNKPHSGRINGNTLTVAASGHIPYQRINGNIKTGKLKEGMLAARWVNDI